MADVVKALVEIAATGFRIPVVPGTKLDIGVTPHRRCPIYLTGREWKTSKIVADHERPTFFFFFLRKMQKVGFASKQIG